MNIAALLAGLFSGIIGAMGMGGGAVLIIYLTLFTDTKQLTAQGINLLFFIPIAITAVTVYAIKKQIRWKKVLFIALFGTVGTFLGLMLADKLGGDFTAKLFGGFLVIIGIREIFRRKTKTVAQKKK